MGMIGTPEPVEVDLAWALGETWLLPVDLLGPTGSLLPSQVGDLQMRIASATDVLFDLSAGAGVSFPDPASAEALVVISPAQQADFVVGAAYRYEIRLVADADQVFTLQYGALAISPAWPG